MTLIGVVTMMGACVGLTIASLGLAFSSAPGWRSQRAFYLLALACGIYCACDVVATIEAANIYRRVALQTSLFSLSAGAASWWLLVRERFPSVYLTRLTWVMVTLHGVMGVAALIPGFAVSSELRTRHVEWLGITYYDLQPTFWGELFLYAFGCSLLLLVLPIAFAFRRGVQDARLYCIWIFSMLTGFGVDSLAFIGAVNGPYISPAVFVGVMVAMGVMTARRFVANAWALDALSTDLEKRVAMRTQELADAQAALSQAEKMAALGQLAAGLAHEINNPAGAVTANLNYLRTSMAEGRLPEDALSCMDESHESMRRIASIVKQLLDTGRAVARGGVPESATHQTNVAQTANDAWEAVRPIIPAKTELRVEIPASLHVRGSPPLLERILANLIANAGHAISDGGGHGRIVVHAKASASHVLLEVRDDGCGMDEQTRKRAFDPFFTTRPVGKGTGLGLSVTAGLVRTLGGTLSMESAPGAGTTVRLRLPAAAAAAQLSA